MRNSDAWGYFSKNILICHVFKSVICSILSTVVRSMFRGMALSPSIRILTSETEFCLKQYQYSCLCTVKGVDGNYIS